MQQIRWIAWQFVMAAVFAAIHIAIHGWALSAIMTLALFFVLGVAERVVREQPRALALAFAGSDMITFGGASVIALTGLFLIGWHQRLGATVDSASGLTFAVFGIAIGYLLRVLYRNYLVQLIRGVPTQISERTVVAGMFLSITLIPTGVSHRPFAGFFLTGMAVGFATHLALRAKERSKAMDRRVLSNLLKAFEPTSAPSDVDKAIVAFAKNRPREVERFYGVRRDEDSTALTLVYVASLRSQGKNETALRALDDELDRPYNRELENLVRLLEAQLCSDVPGHEARSLAAIRRALELSPSCPWARVLCLRFEAEMVPDSDAIARGPAPLTWRQSEILEELKVIEQRINEAHTERPLALVVGAAIPATWQTYKALAALATMKIRRHRIAKDDLIQAVLEEPTLAVGYLYLAEYYRLADLQAVAAAQAGRCVDRPDRTRLTRLLLWIAYELDRKKDGHVARTARALLTETALPARSRTVQMELQLS
jgi:hypothetical protein